MYVVICPCEDQALIVPPKRTAAGMNWQLLERWIINQSELDVPMLVGKVIDEGGSIVQCACHTCESTVEICRRLSDGGFLNYFST